MDGFSLPDQITIYQGPHERLARTQRELEELVAETVWHEVAHYFGMNEAQAGAPNGGGQGRSGDTLPAPASYEGRYLWICCKSTDAGLVA